MGEKSCFVSVILNNHCNDAAQYLSSHSHLVCPTRMLVRSTCCHHYGQKLLTEKESVGKLSLERLDSHRLL